MQLLSRAMLAASLCYRRLPLNESIDLTTDERIALGDLEAIHDMARESIAELEEMSERAASLLCVEPEVLARLSELRLRQNRTGRQWLSGPITEAGETDFAGTEPRGPRRGQERTRRATGGKPDNTGRGSC